MEDDNIKDENALHYKEEEQDSQLNSKNNDLNNKDEKNIELPNPNEINSSNGDNQKDNFESEKEKENNKDLPITNSKEKNEEPREQIDNLNNNEDKESNKKENNEEINKSVTESKDNDEFFDNQGIDEILNKAKNQEKESAKIEEKNEGDINKEENQNNKVDKKNVTNFSNKSLLSNFNGDKQENQKEEQNNEKNDNNDNKSEQNNQINEKEIENLTFLSNAYSTGVRLSRGKIKNAIDEYNKIKSQIKQIFIKPEPTTSSATTKEINLMLNLLDYLNVILDVIINHQRLPKIPPKTYREKESEEKIASLQLQNKEKIVSVYKKQYEKLKARLDEVSSDDYVLKLTERIQKLNEDLSNINKDNRQLKTNQIISENLFKKKINSDSITNHLSKLMTDCNKQKTDCDNITKKIQKNLEIIKKNDEKIKKLENDLKEIDSTAHQQFHFVDYDNVKKEKAKDSRRQKQITKLKKQIEIFQHAIVSNQAKYELIANKNQDQITQLESDKEGLAELLKIKKDELDLMKQNSEILRPQKVDLGYPFSFKPIQNTNNSDIIQTNQSSRIKKADVIEQLTKKQKEEEALHNKSQDITGTNTSIVLKNISLKPNFSFSHSKLNNNVKNLQKKNTADDIFITKTGEIKEDIALDEDPEEKKNNIKEIIESDIKEKTKYSNQSNIDKKPEIKENDNLRSKVLNTIMIGEDDLMNRKNIDEVNENKIELPQINNNNNIEHEDVSDTNEQEHVLDEKKEEDNNKEQLNETPNKPINIENILKPSKLKEEKKLPPLKGSVDFGGKKKFQEDEEVIEEVNYQ